MQPLIDSITHYPLLLPLLCGLALLIALFSLLWVIRPMTLVGNCGAKLRKENDLYNDEYAKSDNYNEDTVETIDYPSASIIVYGISNNELTLDYLESLCAQDYPNYDVVLVMDATADNSAMIAEVCEQRFKNVYVTFIPPGSHNLSRRKLALTLGMKAAKGEVVLTTVSNAEIPSSNWVRLMMEPFMNPEVEVVLGYSHMNYESMPSLTRWRREFDDLLTDAQWLGYALANKPYRGDGYNLAFRKELFFQHKGYAGSVFIHSGDDDIFISEIANGYNTRVVLHPETILSINWGHSSNRIWRERKDQYHFTARWLRHAPFFRLGFLNATQWIVSLLCLFVAVFSILSVGTFTQADLLIKLAPAIVAIIILIAFWQTEIILYRRAAATMKSTRLWWAIPFFWLWQPLGNVIFFSHHQKLRANNYTWKRN